MIVSRPPEPTYVEGYERGYKGGVTEACVLVLKAIADTRLMANLANEEVRQTVSGILDNFEDIIMNYEFRDFD